MGVVNKGHELQSEIAEEIAIESYIEQLREQRFENQMRYWIGAESE